MPHVLDVRYLENVPMERHKALIEAVRGSTHACIIVDHVNLKFN